MDTPVNPGGAPRSPEDTRTPEPRKENLWPAEDGAGSPGGHREETPRQKQPGAHTGWPADDAYSDAASWKHAASSRHPGGEEPAGAPQQPQGAEQAASAHAPASAGSTEPYAASAGTPSAGTAAPLAPEGGSQAQPRRSPADSRKIPRHQAMGESQRPAMACCPFLAGGFPPAPPRSWRQRHPFFFWCGILLIIGGIYAGGKHIAASRMVSGPQLGVINVEDIILDAARTTAWIEELRTDADVRGAVVRINSPGGAVAPSQEIYMAVKRLAAEKPVVVSMGSLATSGGYYIAIGSKHIYASPSTLTANIGVRMEIPNIEGLMKTLGVGSTILTTGPYKDAGSMTRPMTDDEQAYFKALLMDMHEQFVAAIAEGRGMTLEQVLPLADGRAMTGRQALKAGLVDALGNLDDAKKRLQELCGLEAADKFTYVEGPPRPQESLREMLGVIFDLTVRQQARNSQPQFYF